MSWKKIVEWPFIALIRVYKYSLSPLIPMACRYTPTCSQYAEQAIRKYGVIRGCIMAAKRLSRCHPWGGHGHDPVP